MTNQEHAIGELQRVAKKVFQHIMINQWPSAAPLPTKDDDPYWAAIQDLDLTVSIHGFGAGRPKEISVTQAADPSKAGQKHVRRGAQEVVAASRGSDLASTEMLAGFLLTGIPERFPKIRWSLIEPSIGWVPLLRREAKRHLPPEPLARQTAPHQAPQ